MDTKTRHALKHDALQDSAQTFIGWMQDNQRTVIISAIILAVVLIVGISATAIYQHQQTQAQAAFGAAMETYLTPLAQAGSEQQPGLKTYPDAVARAKDANAAFLKVADSYRWTSAGKNAEYFAGLTYMEMGQNADAESTLKQVADHGDKNLAALAQMALGALAQQSGRTADAIHIYQDLAKHPTTTVPASQANLALAALYEKTNPQQARQIYAAVKDADKDTAAGQIATQKLAELH
ncbi:MAG TPA: tetratricopeptide repeat protein [Acidobacteriaceae bacterium]|nr:tetratricopeptide repeat protein [Acidobacteriaceae bacterium]